jgi:hypothetical protein
MGKRKTTDRQRGIIFYPSIPPKVFPKISYPRGGDDMDVNNKRKIMRAMR